MPETTSNVEFAHRIHEQGRSEGGPPGRTEVLEILEAVVLAAVAVLTAWSGYQAARWDARSAAHYAQAQSAMVQAQEQRTLAGQDHLYDIVTFNAWLPAKVRGDHAVAADFERRFRPEFATAFAAWMKTDPLRSPNAAPGPTFLPEYHSARSEKAKELLTESHGFFERAVFNRETGDEYVRITVILATVLLLTALSQRFKIRGPRVGLLAVSFVMLTVALILMARFPRA